MLIRVLVLVVLTFTSVIASSSSLRDQMSSGILIALKKVRGAVGFWGSGRILTTKQVEDGVFVFGNEPLYSAGLELVELLKQYRSDYESLSHNDWVEVTETLKKVDYWMDSREGWGNLVVKCYITEILLRSLYKRLSSTDNPEEIDVYRSVLRDLGGRLPSKASMAVIAAAHYGFSIDVNVGRISYGDNQTVVEKLVELEGRDGNGLSKTVFKKNDLNATAKDLMLLEASFILKFQDFVQIYAKPVPLSIALGTYYRRMVWELYLFSEYKKRNIETSIGWKFVSVDELRSIYRGGGFPLAGMPKAISASSHPVAQKYYVERFLEGGLPGYLANFWSVDKLSERSLFKTIHGLE